jgi:hypothetical protein
MLETALVLQRQPARSSLLVSTFEVFDPTVRSFLLRSRLQTHICTATVHNKSTFCWRKEKGMKELKLAFADSTYPWERGSVER